MSQLRELHEGHGQSPWLDNLRREWLQDGELERWVQRGVRGLTSNPSIMQKAMTSGQAYNQQFAGLLADGMDLEQAYWEMVISDIEAALQVLAGVHSTSGGTDGYVSVEVDPRLAQDTAGTIAAARELHKRIGRPNLYVKIPGTAEGLSAIEAMVAEGRSVNVTLLFSPQRHVEVMEAYIRGLQACPGDLSQVAGVASFFISRTDTEVDRRLEAIGSPQALALRGKVAVAQARVAYQNFLQTFSGPRWDALAERGAHPQRPLWASTSTKNPSYPDTLYVDELIGPDTVNTLPETTLEAFCDHGTLARTLDADPASAETILAEAEAAGVDLAEVAAQMEAEGVSAFVKSYEDLLSTLQATADRLSHSGR